MVTYFILKNCLLRSVKLTKNADPDKYSYSRYGIGFDSRSYFSLPDKPQEEIWRNNRIQKGLEPKGLDHTTLTAEAKYSINFTQSNRKFCLSLHYNGSNKFLFVNDTKICQFKEKDSEIKAYPLCLGNVSIYFSANNMIKTGLDGSVYDFFCWL